MRIVLRSLVALALLAALWNHGAMAQCPIDVNVDPDTSYLGFVMEGTQLFPNPSMTVANTLKTESYALYADENGAMKSVSKITYKVKDLNDPAVQNEITFEDDPNAGLRFFVKKGTGPKIEVTKTCTTCPGKVPVEFYGEKVGAIVAHKADASTFETTKVELKVE